MVARWIGLWVVLEALLGCGGHAPQLRYYDFSDATPPQVCYRPDGPTISFRNMSASAGLEGGDIAIRSETGNIDHYRYHRWQAPIARLVKERLAEALAASGRFQRVDIDTFNSDTTVVLDARILRLEGVRRPGKSSVARVILLVTAQHSGADARPQTLLYWQEEPVLEHSVEALVNSLRQALATIALQLAADLVPSARGTRSAPAARACQRRGT